MGEPETVPTATAAISDAGDTTVHAIWNGATEVARWEVFEVSSRREVRVAEGAWNGYDTTLEVSEPLSSIVIVARDRRGLEVGRSIPTTVAQ